MTMYLVYRACGLCGDFDIAGLFLTFEKAEDYRETLPVNHPDHNYNIYPMVVDARIEASNES